MPNSTPENDNANASRSNKAVVCDALVLPLVPLKEYDTGLYKWRYGSPIYESGRREPGRWMRGPCPECGSPTSTYGFSWQCHDDRCCNNASNFACSAPPRPGWWERNVNVFRDGDAWCATLDGFVNLQESVAGFGKTPRDAVSDLLQNHRIGHAENKTPAHNLSFMNDNEKRLTTEDIMGEFGFRLVWLVDDHWADVVAYKITCRDGDGKPMFNYADWQSLPDPVETHEQAEKYLEGFVKWDGCSELNQGQPHWCGANGFKKHCALLRHIYERAFQLMGREPDKPWTDA